MKLLDLLLQRRVVRVQPWKSRPVQAQLVVAILYPAQELAGPFFFGVGAFTSIFIANQLFFKLTGYLVEGAALADVAGLWYAWCRWWPSLSPWRCSWPRC